MKDEPIQRIRKQLSPDYDDEMEQISRVQSTRRSWKGMFWLSRLSIVEAGLILPLPSSAVDMMGSWWIIYRVSNLYSSGSWPLAIIRLKLQQAKRVYCQGGVTGRGKYMKRLDIKGRGRCGLLKKPHALFRFVFEQPDQKKEIRKFLRVKKVAREDKPVYAKLDY